MLNDGVDNSIEMRFAFDPVGDSLGVLLCETEVVERGNSYVCEPVRLVTKMETAPIDRYIPNKPTFRIGRRQLQALSDELARVGIYPSKLPETIGPRVEAHLNDLRHNRNYLEEHLIRIVTILSAVTAE